MARVEVVAGPERRRRWSAEQKRAIVAASLAPGAVVTEIARRAEIGPGQIYRWRRELRVGQGFAQVVIAPAGDDAGCPAAPAVAREAHGGSGQGGPGRGRTGGGQSQGFRRSSLDRPSAIADRKADAPAL